MTRYANAEDRIRRNVAVDPRTECWLWTGTTNSRGYGRVFLGPGASSRYALAHRFSYELFVGPIPDGLHLDHLCRTKSCVNPTHLEPVTARVNVLRSPVAPAAINAAKTHCPQDHELVPVKGGGRATNGARRICLVCRRARWRARDARRRAAAQRVAS